MRKKIVLALGAAATTGSLVVGGAFLNSASAITTAMTLRVEEGPGHSSDIDLGGRGNSQGDLEVFTGKLIDPRNEQVIGRTDGQCVVTNPATHQRVCVEVFTLEHGTIVITGSNPVGEEGEKVDNRSAVTGGTGRYANARGEVVEVGGGHEEAILIKLIP